MDNQYTAGSIPSVYDNGVGGTGAVTVPVATPAVLTPAPPKDHNTMPRRNPTALVDCNGIPEEIRKQNRWVFFKLVEKGLNPDGTPRMKKEPAHYRGELPVSSSNPESWKSWGKLMERADHYDDAMANKVVPSYAFGKDEPYVVLDFDNAYDPDAGQWAPGVLNIVQAFGSYTEWSMRGKGLHVICRGSTDLHGDREIVWDGIDVKVEVYADKHFISLTGKPLTDSSGKPQYLEIQDCQEQLDKLAQSDSKFLIQQRLKDITPVEGLGEASAKVALPDTITACRIDAALPHIPAEDREVWRDIGMGLRQWGHENGCDDAAWLKFDKWSRTTTANNYISQEHNYKQWHSFDPEYGDGGVTLGTLFHYAKGNGWDGSYDQPQSNTGSIETASGKRGSRKEEDRVVPADVADAYAKSLVSEDGETLPLAHSSGRWFECKDRAGWAACPEEDVEGDVVAFMQGHPDYRGLTTQSFVRSVLMNLRSPRYCKVPKTMPCWIDDSERDATGWVSFANDVVVNVVELARNPGLTMAEYRDKGIVLPSGPQFFSKSYVDFDFDPAADSCPEFDKYMNRSLPDPETQKMVEECMGLVVSDLIDYETFWVAYGDGSNGKNVFQDLLKMLVGPQNVSAVRLETLSERFQAWPLAENRLNINDELPSDIGKARLEKVEDKLKSFVSGGDVEVEFKGRDKYVMPCTARFLFSTNALPAFRDRSNGMWRRMLIIDFCVSIPKAERIPKLAERHLRPELPAIFMRAVAALGRILACGKVFEGAKSRLMKDEHRGLCDPEKMFLTTCYEPGEENYFIPTQFIYDAYRAWCAQNGRKRVSQQKLMARLPKIFPDARVGLQKMFHGSRRRGVMGIREQQVISDEITPTAIGYGTLITDGRSPDEQEASSLRLVETRVKEIYTAACA